MAIQLTPLSTYASGSFAQGAAEIVAYDPATRRLFVINAQQNTVDILDASNPRASLNKIGQIDLSAFGGGANSVAVKNGIVAVAIEATVKQNPGTVVFLDSNGTVLNAVPVGALPDMLTFTPDGTKVLVANEGEPNSYNRTDSVDPEGSVSIIDLSGGVAHATVITANFTAFNNQKEALKAAGVRIFGPNATVAQDFEPEYITVSEDGKTAWIALQENNALAVLDIDSGTITEILPLGYKDLSLRGNDLDASDRDSSINIQNWAGVPLYGMYLPDSIAAYKASDGQTYIVTANEGDSRADYPGFNEEARIGGVNLDPTAFPNASDLKASSKLGRLKVTRTLGDTDGDGDYDELYAFGSRSFSIRDTKGNLVYDSGDDFERIIAHFNPGNFNSNHEANGSFDDRSDDKGPEPEALAVGKVNGRTYAFIGMERDSGIMVYDITNPDAVEFVQYINNRNFNGNAAAGTAGDLGPEGFAFVSAEDSPTGEAMLMVANEISGTTTAYGIGAVTPATVPTGAIFNRDRPDEDNKLFGTTGNDQIYGFGKKDEIFAGEGQDVVYGGTDNDRLNGEAGDDLLLGEVGDDLIRAGSGHDLVWGGRDKDTIEGGMGHDNLYGGEDDDQLKGGDDNDVLYGNAGNDKVEGGAGDDVIYGGGGNDELRGNDGNDILFTDAGNDRVEGGNGNDIIYGSIGCDDLKGNAGNDVLRGNTGDDKLDGQDQDDYLSGGLGDDEVIGGKGFDTLYGDQGNDKLDGHDQDDLLYGGKGNDELLGGKGADTLIGVNPNETLAGHGEIDKLKGEEDADLYVLGDLNQIYYRGQGNNDYALVDGFQVGIDKLQLRGSSADYRLDKSPSGLDGGAAIFSGNDLIAILKGVDPNKFNLAANTKFV